MGFLYLIVFCFFLSPQQPQDNQNQPNKLKIKNENPSTTCSFHRPRFCCGYFWHHRCSRINKHHELSLWPTGTTHRWYPLSTQSPLLEQPVRPIRPTDLRRLVRLCWCPRRPYPL